MNTQDVYYMFIKAISRVLSICWMYVAFIDPTVSLEHKILIHGHVHLLGLVSD